MRVVVSLYGILCKLDKGIFFIDILFLFDGKLLDYIDLQNNIFYCYILGNYNVNKLFIFKLLNLL